MALKHVSYTWQLELCFESPRVEKPAEFNKAMENTRYPRSSRWCPNWAFHNTIGPTNLWGAEAIGDLMDFKPGMRVLDLGCGAASTSIFMALEHGVEVWAVDLWVDPNANHRRIVDAGLERNVFPLKAGAHQLPFPKQFFDAIVSIDAYQYFGTDVRYLSYLSQFLKVGGKVGVYLPANEIDPNDMAAQPLEHPWANLIGADWFTFRSANWWRRHWGHTHCVDVEFSSMVEHGHDDWTRWAAATLAAHGPSPDLDFISSLLESPAGRSLGFCAIIARRNDEQSISLGIAGFEDRIA